jgi:hypothetical protein
LLWLFWRWGLTNYVPGLHRTMILLVCDEHQENLRWQLFLTVLALFGRRSVETVNGSYHSRWT